MPPVARPWQCLTPLAIALVTFAVFAPTLGFGFVDFDDPRIIASNPHFRGLGWPQLRWMATATLMGHWMPVTWLTYGLDYTLWGMWPGGYHLGNVLLHSVDAGLLFVLSRRLLAHALPGRGPVALTLGATFAALIFALHPMRAESVAWVTERRDVVSGFFFLLTILAYLRLIEASGESRRCWRLVALACFALALASKAIVMTLPAMLLVLDVFPLRRPLDRRLLLEKVPFFALSLVSAVITVLAVRAETEFSSIAALPPGPRLLIALHAFAFYASRLLVPFDLSPLHELPPVVALEEPRFLVSAVAVLAVTAALVATRRRWPGALAAWIAYIALLLPVSGLLQQGGQLVAERYSYLPSMAIGLLAGGAMVRGVEGAPRARRALIGTAVLWLTSMVVLTVLQSAIWRDPGALWGHAVAVDPRCAACQNQLGSNYAKLGLIGPAISHLEAAARLQPGNALFCSRLGFMRLSTGRVREGLDDLERAARMDPSTAEVASNLGLALGLVGRPADAVPHLERAVRLDPQDPTFRAYLARAYIAVGRHQDAQPHIAAVRRVDPRLADELSGLLRR